MDDEYRVEKVVTTRKNPTVRVVLTNCMFRCTKCQGLFPASDVGLRVSKNDDDEIIVRNQAQCSVCR